MKHPFILALLINFPWQPTIMFTTQFPRLQLPMPIVFQLQKINCKLPSISLQLNIPLQYNRNSNHIPYLSYDDPMHSQK